MVDEENVEEGQIDVEKYRKAGAIAWRVLQKGRELVKPGVRLLEVAEAVEKMIAEEGAKPAFPVNISRGAEAAHYTPYAGDETVFGEKDVVKLDVGVHVDGWIGDTALTVDLSGEKGALLEASRAALEAAAGAMKPGKTPREIGVVIEGEIKKRGFRPIENLTGHRVAQYSLHAGGEIPNVGRGSDAPLEEGQVFAVEPFATEGAGSVEEGTFVEIFSMVGRMPTRMRESRRIIDHVEREYRALPFAERWLLKEFKSKLLLETALRELILSGAMRQYPVLSDVGKGIVSQAEYTMLIVKDGVEILTG